MRSPPPGCWTAPGRLQLPLALAVAVLPSEALGAGTGGAGAGGFAPVVVAALVGALVLAGLMAGCVAAIRWVLRQEHGSVALIILAAGFVLLLGRCWVTPLRSGDEVTNFSSSLVGALAWFDLIEYPHPALYFDLAASLHALAMAVAGVTGSAAWDAVAGVLLDHHADLLFVSRVLASLAWLGVAVVAWRMALRVCRVPGAALVALALVIPAEPEYPTSFSPYAFGVFLSYLMSYVALFQDDGERPGVDRAAVLGALAGLAVGAHYLSGMFLWVVPIAFLVRPGLRNGSSVAVFLLLAALAFVVANPRVLLDHGQYFKHVAYRFVEIGQADPRRVGLQAVTGPTHEPTYYLGVLARRSLGYLSLAGVLAVLWGPRVRAAWAALGVPLVLLVLLSVVSTRYLQYLLFVLPALAVLCAVGLSALLEVAGRFPPVGPVLLPMALALCACTSWWNAEWTRPGEPTLRDTDPVTRFEARVAAVAPAGADLGVNCPDLALFEEAGRRGRLPEGFGEGLARQVERDTGRRVRWVPQADLNVGREPDWLYLVEWNSTAGGFLPPGTRLTPIERVESGGFVHTILVRTDR